MSKTILNDVIDIISGGTPKTSAAEYWNNGTIGWLSINDFNNDYRRVYTSEKKITEKGLEESNTKLLKTDDIIISARGTVGVLAQIGTPMAFNQSCFGIRGKAGVVDNTYLYYALKNYVSNIRKMGQGSVFSTINLDSFKIMEIDLEDDFLIQGKIAAILSALDDKIEHNNKINAELEQMVKTLYGYWFVQFDFPNAKSKPYKSSGGKMVYNKILKREVPDGWEVSTFIDWVKETKTGDWGKDTAESNYIERVFCVRGADINGINGKGAVKVPERFISKNNTSKVLSVNDFVIEISGGSPTQSTGRMALLSSKMFERFNAPVICSNFCKAISLKEEKYVFNFQQEWQRLYDANIFFGFEGKTSGIKNFLFDSFVNSYHVILPPKDVVEKFYEFAHPLEEKRQNNLFQNQQLAALRDWLLPMLMNGQAKVLDNYGSSEETINTAFEPPKYQKGTQLNIPSNKKGFAKQVLAGRIISLFKNDPHFTDIKFQKIQFLAEHIIQADLNLNYYYQAAGPYDNVFMHTIYNDLKKNKWYDCKDRKFTALGKQIKIEEYYQNYFGPTSGQLDTLFRLLSGATEAKSEIIATIYAVWNNFIIERKQVAEDELIQSFYDWSERKHQYTKPQVMEGLQWLRENKLEPTGFGKLIKKAKSKK